MGVNRHGIAALSLACLIAGPAAVVAPSSWPGDPIGTGLIKRIKGTSLPRMPRDGAPFLNGEEIALIEQWIADGVRDSASTPAPVPAGSRVRLHGTLVSPNRLDDVELVITRSTRIDKSPRSGDHVEVRGTIDAVGGVVDDRMRPRN